MKETLFFIDYISTEKRYSEHTIEAYKNDLERFVEFITVNYPEINAQQTNARIIRQWLLHLLENNYSSRTVARKVATLKSWFNVRMKDHNIKIKKLV